MQWGREEDTLRHIERETGVTPNALAVKPGLDKGGFGILHAYDLLDQSRLHSEIGPQALQMSEILAYLEISGVEDGYDRLFFLRTIKRLDVIYLNHCAEKQKK